MSNLKISPNKNIKDFNSRFNKFVNKIPNTSRPSYEVLIEWFISALSTNIAMFVDRENKMTLADNMKEVISIEKHIFSLEKKIVSDERRVVKKEKKDLRKKHSKYAFDVEVLKKIINSMTIEIVELKRQVAESSSRKGYRPMKRNSTAQSFSPPPISIVESNDDEEAKDKMMPTEEEDEEKINEVNTLRDFLHFSSDNETEE